MTKSRRETDSAWDTQCSIGHVPKRILVRATVANQLLRANQYEHACFGLPSPWSFPSRSDQLLHAVVLPWLSLPRSISSWKIPPLVLPSCAIPPRPGLRSSTCRGECRKLGGRPEQLVWYCPHRRYTWWNKQTKTKKIMWWTQQQKQPFFEEYKRFIVRCVALNMFERDGKDQGEGSPKQACSYWFARHSWLATVARTSSILFGGVADAILRISGVVCFSSWFCHLILSLISIFFLCCSLRTGLLSLNYLFPSIYDIDGCATTAAYLVSG